MASCMNLPTVDTGVDIFILGNLVDASWPRSSFTSPWLLTVSISVGIAVILMIITADAALRKVNLFSAGRQPFGGSSVRGALSPK
ncbi:hypothetical protein Y032_0189g1214 [Ancylostoma ceylanicum]|uniref:Uncharacterized protein n=1 Tax=Ancylostoma ceylanicum TaxID=53326 RepID=A0A016SRD4_9BILA|nr:hypothetical protein Y032_0189g1214 [Ancylostoma ceylanicum]